ncbi:MAG: branched-chain amino acid ABC transporter permease [Acidobacteria bacterium]|nr:branched-chain amino acid ABC transporter permease [Acidobacteriota bacterium]
MRATLDPSRFGSLLSLILLALLALIPYGLAAVTGQAKEGLTGLAALHSAAESVYCEPGLTPVGIVAMVETGLLLTAVLAAPRLGAAGAFLKENGWYLLGVAALMALPFVIGWRTDSSVCKRGEAFFWESVFVDVFIIAILAISYNLMFGFTGVVSFGHAAFFGLGAYNVGLLMHHASWPWWLAVAASLLIGVVIALVKGVVGLRIKGLYFALFTLAFAQVFFLLAGNRLLTDITGAEDGFTFDVPDWLNITQNRLFFYYLALAALALAFWLVRRLMNSPTGRVLAALRDNESRAQMLGYNIFYFKLIAIVIAGLMATGAGVLRGIALKGASPEVLSLTYTFDPLLMTLVGGQGTFLGPVVGAFGLHLIEDFLRDTVLNIGGVEVNIGERWALILGVLFILSVMVFPYGIVGTVRLRWQKWRAAQIGR